MQATPRKLEVLAERPVCHPDRVELREPRRWDELLRERGGWLELLRIPALLYGAAVRARRAGYDSGLLRAHVPPVPVLSVGNLSAGGTGKTPLCIWLARELAALGRHPGLVSRGYRGGADGRNDEAQLFAGACPDVPQIQDADRVRAVAELARRGVDLVLLDDGFQHRRLARSQDWVLIDALRPWGLPCDERGRSVRALLPRGLLREPPFSLKRADVLLLTRTDELAAERLAELEGELARFAPGKPVLLAVHRPTRLVDQAGRAQPLSAVSGREVELASAIGNPQAFESSVRALGARVVARHVFPDHHRYSAAEATELGQRAGSTGRLLLVTQKDAVKLAPLGLEFLALEVEFEVVRGAAIARALLESLPAANHERG